MRIATSRTSRAAHSSSTIALFACGLLAWTAGEAASVANGHNLNGSNLNGQNLNGVNLNGVNLNGVSVNGVTYNVNGAGFSDREHIGSADRGDRARLLDINRLRVTGVTLARPPSVERSGS